MILQIELVGQKVASNAKSRAIWPKIVPKRRQTIKTHLITTGGKGQTIN